MSPRRARAVAARSDATPAQALREHLVDAATDVLRETSPSAATTRVIARRAGVSDGVLYNHFADKHELLLAALMRRYDEVLGEIDHPVAGEGSVIANLERIARGQVAFQARLLPLLTGLLGEPALLHRFFAEIHRHPRGPGHERAWIVDYLAAEQRLGRVSADASPVAVSSLLMGTALLLAFTDHLGPVFHARPTVTPAADPVAEIIDTLIGGLAA